MKVLTLNALLRDGTLPGSEWLSEANHDFVPLLKQALRKALCPTIVLIAGVYVQIDNR